MLSFLRIIKFSLQDIVRNLSLSLTTILILILMLLSINTLIGVRILTQEAITSIKNQIDVSIYFNAEAKDAEIGEVKTYLSSFPEVLTSTYFTSAETLAKFKEMYRDSPKILETIEELGGNPLGAMLVVKTRDPKDYVKIIKALSVPEYDTIIEAKTFGDTEKAIEKIQVITNQVEKFSLALTSIFALISFIIIFNTIRVAIFTHRTEISIKKLVGASNWFVRGPYLVESLLFSIIAVVISFGTVRFAARFSDPYISAIFERSGILTNYVNSHIMELVGVQFAAVLALTFATSLLAMRKYLRV
ncbi:MAG: permease-like cell division protein FtsX [Patescibacteria group bacterium]